jgi:hypothetical protein
MTDPARLIKPDMPAMPKPGSKNISASNNIIPKTRRTIVRIKYIYICVFSISAAKIQKIMHICKKNSVFLRVLSLVIGIFVNNLL